MSFTSTTYRGHDLLTEMPNGREERDEGVATASDILDNAVGQVAIARAWAGPVLTRPHLFTLPDRATITAFLHWCALRRGAYRELWVPTWRRDFALATPALSSDTDLIVSATGYPTTGFASESRRHLAVIVAGGGARTVYPRRIEAAEDNGDGTETLTLESAVGVTLDTHVALSFLVLCRLQDDSIPIDWLHLGAAEARVRFVELPRQVDA